MTATLPVVDRVRRLARDPVGMAPLRTVDAVKRGKSAVFRLRDEAGRVLIAKRCVAATARIEATIYRDVLAHLDLAAPKLHAFVDDGRHAWLFMDDAAGRSFDSNDASHREIAGRWLADLHGAAAPMVGSVDLPTRDIDYFRGVASGARRTVAAADACSTWPTRHRATLHALYRALDVLDARWDDVAAAAASLPPTLVHGGFAGKNVHVRGVGASARLVAFDWEAGGWGLPLPDLSRVSLSAYRGRSSRPFRGAFTASHELATIGTALWNVAPIPGELPTVRSGHVTRVAEKFAYYHAQITRSLAALGWWTGAAP